MAITNFDSLNPMHVDVLTELGNIGSGNAASSLSDMTEQKVQIKVPEVMVLKFKDIVEFFGGDAEKLAIGLLVTLTGDIEGMILYLFGDSFVNEVLDAFFKKRVSSMAELNEMDKSTMLEIGNIMASSYVNAFSRMTEFSIKPSVPSLAIDMAGSLLSVPVVEFGNISENILFINDCFIINGKEVDSHMILIPTIHSLNVLFKKLGVET